MRNHLLIAATVALFLAGALLVGSWHELAGALCFILGMGTMAAVIVTQPRTEP